MLISSNRTKRQITINKKHNTFRRYDKFSFMRSINCSRALFSQRTYIDIYISIYVLWSSWPLSYSTPVLDFGLLVIMVGSWSWLLALLLCNHLNLICFSRRMPSLSFIQNSLYVGVVEKILPQHFQGSSTERWSQWIRQRHLTWSNTHDVVSREINLRKGFDFLLGSRTCDP